MVYTTNNLIADSYYTAGVVARDFETVSGQQVNNGLRWLNDILTDKRIDKGMVSYETTMTFSGAVGQEKYFIPNLVQIDTITFLLNSVRYPMKYTKRNEYFGSARVNNVQTLPFSWYVERAVGGANLYIYFPPDQNYQFEIHGIFNVNPVSLGQDLSSNVTTANLGVPTFYGNGALSEGQLVISTSAPITSNSAGMTTAIDLSNNSPYPNIGALANYINSGVIPGVRASIVVNDFILSSTTEPPLAIYVQTAGFSLGGNVGTNFVGNVAAATTANLTATYNNGTGGIGATLTAPAPAILTVDGQSFTAPSDLFKRILVKNQASPAQNGSYEITTLGTGSVAWVLTRTGNYDQSVEVKVGDLFTATNGAVNAGLTFIQELLVSVMGTSSITFTQFNAVTFSNFSTIESADYEVFNAYGFDQFYTTYLQFALAKRICAEYGIDTPVNVVEQLAEYQEWIRNKSRVLDLSGQKSSTLQRRGTLSWAQINLGKGFTVPS